MSRNPYPSVGALLDDCAACAADQVIAEAGGPAWDADGLRPAAGGGPRSACRWPRPAVVDVVARVLAAAHEVEVGLDRAASPALAPAVADARAQFAGLIYPGFVAETGAARLPDLVRYLRASPAAGQGARRAAPRRRADGDRAPVTEAYRRPRGPAARGRRDGAGVQAVRWMIEELRVSLFAQALGTTGPVSERRILAALDRLAGAG